MGCSNLCSCQFNWPIDTQGSKRDPVNSEKAWLDFAVRFLSREAVGKGRGQETVWSAACKPSWWNSEVGLPWKNPTSNPKDTKEVLLQKYDALEKHLKKEGRFPQELAEEARLWGEGKYKELYLLTSLTSLRGKVTGVHSSITDAAAKTDELKANINQLLLQDIKTCLKSTLTALENLSCKNTTKNNLKRPCSRAENSESAIKIQKLDVSKNCTTQKNSRLFVPFSDKKKVGTLSETNPATMATISAFSERLLAKQRELKENILVNSLNKNVPNSSQIMSSPVTADTNIVTSPIAPEMGNLSAEALSVAVQSSPLCINISQEELNQLLKGNPVPLDRSENDINSLLINSNKEISITQNSSDNPHNVNPSTNSPCFESHKSMSHHEISTSEIPVTDSIARENHTESDDLDSTFDFLEAIDFQANNQLMTPDLGNEILSDTDYNPSSLTSPIDDLLNEASALSSQLTLPLVNTDRNETVNLDRAFSNEIKILDPYAGHTSQSSQNVSDHGYSSDEGALHLSSMYSSEEQTQLWEDDGSYLLDRFMTDLEMAMS